MVWPLFLFRYSYYICPSMATIMNKHLRYVFFSLRLLVAILLTSGAVVSCNNGEPVPDVSDISIAIRSKRLDRDLAAIDTNNIAEGLSQLRQQYPGFLDFYLDTLMGFNIRGHYSDTVGGIREGVRSLLTYKDYRNLFDTVAAHYPDTKDVEEQLKKGFQYVRYYYPSYQVPEITYFISGLNNWGVVSFEHGLGIGLDMFLGPKYPFYKSVGQADYMYIHFRKEAIAPAVFSEVFLEMHPYNPTDKTLLELMIEKGKQQYFLRKVLPFVKEEDRLGYTSAQLAWCEANEGMIYNYFVNSGLLYDKNWLRIMRYVSYGPTSTGMPAESPGNIGAWLGLQILKAYSNKHPETSPEQLFRMENAEKILAGAKYKPKNS